MKAIPTRYRNIQFRSRLEARWASFFDEIGWRWEYEPFSVGHYIPDFVIMGDRQLLVEVKPVTTYTKAASIAATLEPFLPDEDVPLLVVGTSPHMSGETCGNWPLAGCLSQWSQWDDEPGTHAFATGVWARCRECASVGVYHEIQAYLMHPCGHYDGDHHLGYFESWEIEQAWTEARNVTQWFPS